MRIFLSHSSSDADFCASLVRALRDSGADVWYDDQNLGAGNLLEAIQREIRSREVFIVVLSPAALSSPWVREECIWAHGRYLRERQRIILPIVAETLSDDWLDDWLFLASFKRVEKPGGLAYPGEEAIAQTLRMLNLPGDGPDAEELIAEGEALAKREQHEEAMAAFEQATQVDPENPEAWRLLGDELFFLADSQWVRSLSDLFSETVQDQRERKERTERRRHDFEQALDAYTQALTLDPTIDYVWFQKGRTLAVLDRYKEALAAFEAAAAAEPDDLLPLILCWRGEMLLTLDRLEEALAAYNHALTEDPDSELARDGKAMVLEAMAEQVRRAGSDKRVRKPGMWTWRAKHK